jgi:5-methylcytosine-specific restriction endonuclease McrA
MKKELAVTNEEIILSYKELKNVVRVAKKFGVTRHQVIQRLKNLETFRNRSQAAKDRGAPKVYIRTDAQRERLSEIAKERIGEKHPQWGKPFTEERKKKISDKAKLRYGQKNANFRHGKNIRRPRDFKTAEFKPIRNFVYNRDKHTCHYCKQQGGHIHAHHRIPFWIAMDAFMDVDNIITVCTKCHFEKAHLGNWQKFDISLITDELIEKYSVDRERLNELATKNW